MGMGWCPNQPGSHRPFTPQLLLVIPACVQVLPDQDPPVQGQVLLKVHAVLHMHLEGIPAPGLPELGVLQQQDEYRTEEEEGMNEGCQGQV